MTASTSTEITQSPVFDDGVLSGIKSFEDALQAFQDAGLVPESVTDYGTGFSILENKRTLVGVPFIILEWRFNESEKFKDENGQPRAFVSAEVVTKHGEKFILNDGSTGIARQLRRVTDQRREKKHSNPQAALYCPKGLTVSEYTYTDEKGAQSDAETYYLGE